MAKKSSRKKVVGEMENGTKQTWKGAGRAQGKFKAVKKEKAADELIERANRLLLRAWQKTYDNRHHRLS